MPQISDIIKGLQDIQDKVGNIECHGYGEPLERAACRGYSKEISIPEVMFLAHEQYGDIYYSQERLDDELTMAKNSGDESRYKKMKDAVEKLTPVCVLFSSFKKTN